MQKEKTMIINLANGKGLYQETAIPVSNFNSVMEESRPGFSFGWLIIVTFFPSLFGVCMLCCYPHS